MKNTIQAILFVFLYLFFSQQVLADSTQNEKNYFQFEIANYHTQRQSGQTLNLYVRYAYKDNLDPSLYPDYRLLQKAAMEYLEPNEKFPENVFWEVLATQIGRNLVRDYPLSAISVQMEVLDNPAGGEPGTHGPVYTQGNIPPLDIHH